MSNFDLKVTPKYTLLDSSETDQWLIKIEEGDFKDVVYKYNTVRTTEETDANGNGVLQFTYDVVYDAEIGSEHLTPKSEDFVNTIGDILYNMIVEQFNDKDAK